MSNHREIDAVDLSVYWARLVAITSEAAISFRRAAFSTIATEAMDFSVALFSAKGELVAQPAAGLAAFAGTLARTIPKMLSELTDGIRPGDVYMTNDAWLGSGQLNDYFFLTPVHHRGRLVAFAATVAHSQDVGGQVSTRSREIYHEGIQVPVSRFAAEGTPNEELLRLIAKNVRVPETVIGDFYSQAAANRVMAARLLEFLEEVSGLDVDQLFDTILDLAEKAMLDAVSRLPDGSFTSEIEGEAPDGKIVIKVTVRIAGGSVDVDFTGTSPQSPYAINCTENFSIGRALAPIVTAARPGGYVNGGSYRHIRMTVPEGSVLNARYPAATASRFFSSGLIATALFDALSAAAPDAVLAGCASPVWGPIMVSTHQGKNWVRLMPVSGGMGARPSADGVSCLTYPDSTATIRPEAIEDELPLLILTQEFLTDSGGAGRYRGGLGQRLAIQSRSDQPIHLAFRAPRLGASPRGLNGGGAGARGRIYFNGVEQSDGTAEVSMRTGDVVEFRTPGGGGHGDPQQRDARSLEEDVCGEKISPEAARTQYGWHGDGAKGKHQKGN